MSDINKEKEYIKTGNHNILKIFDETMLICDKLEIDESAYNVLIRAAYELLRKNSKITQLIIPTEFFEPEITEQIKTKLNLFLDDCECKDKINNFLDYRNKIINYMAIIKDENVGPKNFLSIEIIKEYLGLYFRMLAQILQENNPIFRMKFYNGKSILWYLLHLDINFEKNFASIINPINLNLFWKANKMIIAYNKRKPGRNLLMTFFDKQILRQKIINSSRWNIHNGINDVQQVSVTTYMDENKEASEIDIPYRDLNSYSGYEGICELRLGGKIMKEYTEWKENRETAENEFKIVLFGDINKKPLIELGNMLDDKRGDDDSNKIKIVFFVYTNNSFEDDYEDNLCESYKRKRGFKIQKVNNVLNFFDIMSNIKQIINDNNLIMMLDSVNLYNPLSSKTFIDEVHQRQKFLNLKFSDAATGDSLDAAKDNYLDELYQEAEFYENYGYTGKYNRTININFILRCRDILNEHQNQNKVMYIYVSNVVDFVNSRELRGNQMRIERYNQKEIGILRFDGGQKGHTESLPTRCKDKDDKFIAFDLWQVTKHFCLSDRKKFFKMLEDEYSLQPDWIDALKMQDMYFFVDYTDWKSAIKINYNVSDDLQAKWDKWNDFMEKIGSNLIIPMLDKDNLDLFKQYYNRTFLSIFYGNALNVQDMLFVYLWTNKTKSLGPVILGEKCNKSYPKNDKYKYANKANVEDLIQTYHNSRNEFALRNALCNYYNSLHDKKEDDILNALKEICENLNYKESLLYENCSKP